MNCLKAGLLVSVEFHSVFSVVPDLDRVGVDSH